MKKYFELSSGNEDVPLKLTDHTPIKCDGNGKGCGWQNTFKPRKSIHFRDRQYADVPFFSTSGFHVVREDLLELLGTDFIKRRFWIGDVTFSSMVTDAKFYHLNPKKPTKVIIRGPDSDVFRVCLVCQRPLNLRFDDIYFLQRDVKGELPLYHAFASIMIIREDIAKKILKKKMKRIDLEPMPIREKPIDGLPVDLFKFAKQLIESGGLKKDGTPKKAVLAELAK